MTGPHRPGPDGRPGSAISRRRLLTGVGLLGLGASGLAVGAGCAPIFTRRADTVSRTGTVLPSSAPRPKPYTVELPRVATARPTAANHYTFTQRAAEVEILPGQRTTVWGYDGQFPGPTVEARTGQPITVTVRNELPTPTSTHLHGGVTPADSDGLPTDLIMPTGFDRALLDEAMSNGHAGSGAGHPDHGSTADLWTLHDRQRDYHYPIDQDAALLWYHDHRMDFSAPQVWRGLAGMAVIRDDHEDSLDLPAGDAELLLMITDRSFGTDGQLLYPALDPTLTRQPGVEADYMDGVLGDVMLVNGAPSPVAQVAATRYRLRMVNGCNARPLRLRLRPGSGPDLTVQQIGTDSGLLPAPVPRTLIVLHPGERVDVVVDLSELAVGTEVELTNDTTDPTDPTAQVMKLAIDRRGQAGRPVPARLAADYQLLQPADAVTARDFDFRMADENVWTVNGKPYDPIGSIADPRMGTIERWSFSSDFNHPVHLHLGHFQVISVDGREVDPAERGWKDTVNLTPFGVVEVLVRFPAYRGRYMLHCHNLEHEDMAMMANVDVT